MIDTVYAMAPSGGASGGGDMNTLLSFFPWY